MATTKGRGGGSSEPDEAEGEGEASRLVGGGGGGGGGGEKAPEASQDAYIAASSTVGSKALGRSSPSPCCSFEEEVGAALTAEEAAAEEEVEEVEEVEVERRSTDADGDDGHDDDDLVDGNLLMPLVEALAAAMSALRPWIAA